MSRFGRLTTICEKRSKKMELPLIEDGVLSSLPQVGFSLSTKDGLSSFEGVGGSGETILVGRGVVPCCSSSCGDLPTKRWKELLDGGGLGVDKDGIGACPTAPNLVVPGDAATALLCEDAQIYSGCEVVGCVGDGLIGVVRGLVGVVQSVKCEGDEGIVGCGKGGDACSIGSCKDVRLDLPIGPFAQAVLGGSGRREAVVDDGL
ncbi:hypothetical protein Dimus_025672 [Dionaea muscipula]